MIGSRRIPLSFLSLLPLLVGLLAAPGLGAQASLGQPGPAEDKVMFRAFDVDRAPRDLEAGNMDLYMYSLKTAAAERLRRDPAFALYEAPASTVSLLLNPAPAPEGELNPFSIREVRRAMQYLVDREFVARDIYRGLAVPMVSQVSPQDYDYLTVYDVELAADIGYDPEYGRKLISTAMQKAGAVLSGGLWSYKGQPIRVRLIGRVEDERRNIADLARTELEKAGFMVAVSYRPFAAAVNTVYSSDPRTLEWHIYTEGWGKSAPERYDFATVNQMNAPWLGNMPGWQEVGFWQYQQPEMDELGKKLFRGEFASLEERNRIYRRMTELGLQESVRIWLVTAVNTFPANKELKGVTTDLVSGLRSPWTLREAYMPGKKELTVGDLWVWTERTTWNPVGGFGDVYSTDIWRNLQDPAIWNHPFTGLPEPVRVRYRVETAGPSGKLAVPADAVLWDAAGDRWQPVGSGKRATSKVTYDYGLYMQSRWHHGARITMADLLYGLAQSYELAYDKDKARIEVALGVTARPYLETFRGFRVLDDHRVEVYVDYWHFEQNHIASYATPGGLGMPWEVLAAMDDLVFSQRRAAYSDTAAARFNVPWLSLVMERDALLVERTLERFAQDGFVPAGVFQVGGRSLVSPQEARARYQAAIDWYKSYGHLVISNGPFFLARYDPPAQYAELRAFRDPSYPFKPGDWYYGSPPTLQIKPPAVFGVQAGRAASLPLEVEGPGKLGLKYFLVDPATRKLVRSGEAQALSTASGKGSFQVSLPAEVTRGLFPGLYRLELLGYSDALALVVERSADVEIKP
jgi:peptide/nickel transport system substrate-binding protein